MSEKKPGRRRRPRRGGKRSGSRASASASTTKTGGGRPRQRRRSSKTSAKKSESHSKTGPLIVPQNGSKQMRITNLNRDIFIYTYVHYPRGGADNYQSGPGVAERMEFED